MYRTETRNFSSATRIPQRGLDGSAKVVISQHIRKQMAAKGFTAQQVISALRNPEKVTEVRRYPGQVRYCGAGVAVVVDPRGGEHHLITLYADGVVTPLRADQMNDPEAVHSRRAGIYR